MFYKNLSYTTKTFYGVIFKPGETKAVDGPINSKWMAIVDDPATETTKPSQQKLSSDTIKDKDQPQESKNPKSQEEPKVLENKDQSDNKEESAPGKKK